MHAVERPDLTGPLYLHNNHRVARQAEIEDGISAWTAKRSVEEVQRVMTAAGVPVGRVVSVKEIVEGEQVIARGAVEDVWVGGGGRKDADADADGARQGWNVKMPGVFPVLEGCDAKTRWAGPDLGEHTEEVLREELGLTQQDIAKLREDGVVG